MDEEETSEVSPPYTFECTNCGHRIESEDQPMECPECGSTMKNISKPQE